MDNFPIMFFILLIFLSMVEFIVDNIGLGARQKGYLIIISMQSMPYKDIVEIGHP